MTDRLKLAHDRQQRADTSEAWLADQIAIDDCLANLVEANCSNGSNGTIDLSIYHSPDADLDGTFTAWDIDEVVA